MELIVYLGVLGLMSYAGNRTATEKNRNVPLWTVLCFIFGLVPLLVLFCLPRVNPDVDKALQDAVEASLRDF